MEGRGEEEGRWRARKGVENPASHFDLEGGQSLSPEKWRFSVRLFLGCHRQERIAIYLCLSLAQCGHKN